jgi:hypothetical protein
MSIGNMLDNGPNFNIWFAFHCRAHNFVQKVAKCDEKRWTLIRSQYHPTRIVGQCDWTLRYASVHWRSSIDCSNDSLGIWPCGSVNESNHRLVGGDCTVAWVQSHFSSCEMALGQVCSECFSFPCQSSFQQMLCLSHLSSGAGTVHHLQPKYHGNQSHATSRKILLFLRFKYFCMKWIIWKWYSPAPSSVSVPCSYTAYDFHLSSRRIRTRLAGRLFLHLVVPPVAAVP